MKYLVLIFWLMFFSLNGFSQNSKIDFSGADHFWTITALLKQGIDPSDKEWTAFLETPYYKFNYYSSDKLRNWIKNSITTAFLPEKMKNRDTILNRPDSDYGKVVLLHMIDAEKNKESIQLYQQALTRQNFIDSIISISQQYLPKGTISKFKKPNISFGIFKPDANGASTGIYVDLKFAQDFPDFDLLMAHEAHHYYVGHIRKKMVNDKNDSAAVLINVINQLQLEGIADQIDKEASLASGRYDINNKFRIYYEDPLPNLQKVDSLLKIIYHNPGTVKENGKLINELLPLGGHPHGYYLSQTIKTVLGKKALISTCYNPFDFIRLYNKAAKRKGLFYFSNEAVACLNRLEKMIMK